MDNKPYFVFDPQGDGFSYFETSEERDIFTKGAIDNYLDDMWDDEVTDIVVGKITHKVIQTNRTERPSCDDLDEEGVDSEGFYWGGDISYVCDYKLFPCVYVTKIPSTQASKEKSAMTFEALK